MFTWYGRAARDDRDDSEEETDIPEGRDGFMMVVPGDEFDGGI